MVEKGLKRLYCGKKSQLFEQKVDLKPKTLDFRDFGIFADSEKKSQKCLPKP